MKILKKPVFWLLLLVIGTGAFFIFAARQEPVDELTEREEAEEGEAMIEEDEEIISEEWEAGDSVTPEPQPETYLEVTNQDCENECRSFVSSQEHYRYCRSFCGLSDEEGVAKSAPAPGSCAAKCGIESDYCHKDEAVAAKNLSKCEKITDSNIKKSCQARVTEDLLP